MRAMKLWKHEMKMNGKNLVIWTLCVGLFCALCIPLYSSLEDQLKDMADMYANMGAMSQAFGMDKMSMATLIGFYATEVAIMFSLGGAMYAAILGSGLLSKEEYGHTAEFLYTMPLSRFKIVGMKYLAMVFNLVIFNIICIAMFLGGFAIMGESIPFEEFAIYHGMQLVMQLELASICFLISACTRKNLLGASLGIAIVLYAIDLMCRIIPAMENMKYITPFYYCNGADIFSGEGVCVSSLVVGLCILCVSTIGAFFVTNRRNLS